MSDIIIYAVVGLWLISPIAAELWIMAKERRADA